MPASSSYDPTSEPENAEQVAAAHWECLRRNTKFKDIAQRWLSSKEFRRQHCLSTDYHHSSVHYPRCALDWMLSPSQRVGLFRYQISQLRIFKDVRFNFGPIIQQQKVETQNLRRETIHESITASALPCSASPLTINDPWSSAPELFRQQFRFAVKPAEQFAELTTWIREKADPLRIIARKLASGDRLKESALFAQDLQWLGDHLHDYGEFYRVFAIPNMHYTSRSLRQMLEQIWEAYAKAGQIVSDKKYNLHKSYYGTAEDWRWFLEAESRGLDATKQSDLYRLAEIYSNWLRHQPPVKRRRNVRTAGFRGDKVPSKLLKNRRATMLKHITSIQKWIDQAYPPAPPTK